MQWERTDRPTTILMIHQSHRSTWVNFNTEQMTKRNYSCDIKTTTGHLQLTTHHWVRNTQLWVAGDFHSTAACPLTLTGCFGKAGGKLSQSDWARAVTGANKTGFTALHNFPNATFSSSHSTLWWVMDLSPFSWEQQSSPPFGSSSAPADSPTRLPGQGTQRRQSRGTAPYAHLAWQLQLCFQLHC